MWAGMLHLVVGNALIGAAEGALLAWLTSASKPKCIGVMILANYVSAWLGGQFIRRAVMQEVDLDLTNAWRWFWLMAAATYVLTLLLEWPFVLWCLRGTRRWIRRSVLASLVIQSASYGVLFGWYWASSGTSLYTKMEIVAPAELALPESLVVYFIAADDGNVYRRTPSADARAKVYDLRSTDLNDRLVARPNATDPQRWDLLAIMETTFRGEPQLVDVLTNLPVEAAPDWISTGTDPPQYCVTWWNFGPVQAIRGMPESPWEFHTGFWPVEGLHGSNRTTGERVGFSYETPFGEWTVRNATLLPGDKVLFQLGHDQICAFDPASRRVALLWRGRGPVPVIETSEESSSDGR